MDTKSIVGVIEDCPRIESLLRKSGFWPIFLIKFVKYNKYSPHLIEPIIIKIAASKPLSLATASILGLPPRQMGTFLAIDCQKISKIE
jgi:hypothetical protein